MMLRPKKAYLPAVALQLAILGGLVATGLPAKNGSITATIVDKHGPRSPWGKTTGDIDGDGRPDIVVGGHAAPQPSLLARALRKFGLREIPPSAGELVWYRNPDWEKHTISTAFNVRTDLAVADIDADGLNDVVLVADQGVYWLKNPQWTEHKVTSGHFHDVEVSDLDRDGDMDLVLRDQSLFGHNAGNNVQVMSQTANLGWRQTNIEVDHGEGLRVADLNADGYDDIIVNDAWLVNPGGKIDEYPWSRIDYTSEWTWQDVYIAARDINADGAIDIVLSPAEPAGEFYRISWFEATNSDGTSWVEHVVDDEVEAVHHGVEAGDFDGDGLVDIFASEMNQGEGTNEVKVYFNNGDSLNWNKVVLDDRGLHSIQIADFDDDQDVEIVGTNWQIADYEGDYEVRMWNYDRDLSGIWKRRSIGNNDGWLNLFVYAADLDGDRLTDIVAGRSWFRNPGVLGDTWERTEFGHSLNTALILDDFDADGDVDVFGTEWDGRSSQPGLLLRAKAKLLGSAYPGSGDGGRFLWARNDGSGRFEVFDNIASVEGDYLQGIAVNDSENRKEIFLSWHGTGNGIHRVGVPQRPAEGVWTIERVSKFSQDEQLSFFDLNNDRIADLVTGTSWLDSVDDWEVHHFHETSEPPDRHAVADMNLDGSADAVVGYEATSKKGKLAWYADIGTVSGSGALETVIDYPIGPMSLGVADMDDDGDPDVVVGEHDLGRPDLARLLLYINRDGAAKEWDRTVISRGDEHHNGALIIDIDGDGDKDIVSIGWGHSNVLLFENPALEE